MGRPFTSSDVGQNAACITASIFGNRDRFLEWWDSQVFGKSVADHFSGQVGLFETIAVAAVRLEEAMPDSTSWWDESWDFYQTCGAVAAFIVRNLHAPSIEETRTLFQSLTDTEPAVYEPPPNLQTL